MRDLMTSNNLSKVLIQNAYNFVWLRRNMYIIYNYLLYISIADMLYKKGVKVN